jgi:c-di-GMP-binding flagellar brake protein YcgR
MSEIVDMQKNPIGELILQVTGPENVINDNSRETLRVPVPNIDTEIKFERYSTLTRKAVLKDISVTGGGLLVNSQDKTLQKNNDIIYLTFDLHITKPEQDIKIEQIKSQIKWHKNINKNKMILGVEFIKYKLGQESGLMKYINFVQRVNNWERYVKKIVGDDEI